MKQVALITGAAQNIGKGIARVLLENGYTCVLVDINGLKLKATKDELNSIGECFDYQADVGNFEQLEKLLAWLTNEGLILTALVNNVAYESQVSVSGITQDELTRSFQTNLAGPFYMTARIINDWMEHGVHGGVVFISSVHGQLIRTHPLYSASKAAIEMFVKEAALEFAEHNIRVNAVAPGPTQDTAELQADYRVPLGYYQQPKDIGEGVAFLLSNKARFITGQTLIIDGGFGIAHVHHWLKKGHLSK